MNRGVDIHLHQPDPSGIAALQRIADTIEREPSLKGRVNMSHCYCLMSLAAAVPSGRASCRSRSCSTRALRVYTGTDSVIDHWSVFGTGDVLGKANLACEIYGWEDELSISQSLRLATSSPMPLDAAGEQVRPKPGDAADMVLVPASCSAEAVARLQRMAVFRADNLAAEA
jgi:cytosine/adenosine deaminase-related metal-dependent hydrolase